jgi:hypothetical protein
VNDKPANVMKKHTNNEWAQRTDFLAVSARSHVSEQRGEVSQIESIHADSAVFEHDERLKSKRTHKSNEVSGKEQNDQRTTSPEWSWKRRCMTRACVGSELPSFSGSVATMKLSTALNITHM